ncbi:MAG: hypothetical protein KatS3mg109_0016 [Pirellulaceae bacterium]|nr:MAG: hypothetical protein KatS3mg109_0016 [Pirellulaceae bacterium]
MAYDIAVIDLAPMGRFEEIDPSLQPFDGRQGVVSDLAKLAQSVMFLFTTEPGSIAYDPDLGASPVPSLLASTDLLRDSVNSILSASAQDIVDQLDLLGIGDSPGSRLAVDGLSIWAEDIDTNTGTISIAISVVSEAGDEAVYNKTLRI